MNVARIVACCFILMFGLAHGEVITSVKTESPLTAAQKGVRVAIYDFQGGNFEAIKKLLTDEGFMPGSARDSQWIAHIHKLILVVMEGDQKKVLTMNNLGDYSGVVHPAANSHTEDMKFAAGQDGSNRVRSSLDVDAGVVTQGARLTGSGAGGVAVGMIGALIGSLVDSAAQAKEDAALPVGVAVLKGRLYNRELKDSKPVDVVITAASDTEEQPAALFDAAIKQYVSLLSSGYTPQEKGDLSQKKDEANVKAD